MTEPPPGGYPPPPPEGYPPPPPPQGAYGPPPPGYGAAQPAAGTNGLAVASLVCSLLGWLCYGVLSVVGIVLGIIALNQIKANGQGGKGLAQAGIIIGVVTLVLGIIGGILWVNYHYSWM